MLKSKPYIYVQVNYHIQNSTHISEERKITLWKGYKCLYILLCLTKSDGKTADIYVTSGKDSNSNSWPVLLFMQVWNLGWGFVLWQIYLLHLSAVIHACFHFQAFDYRQFDAIWCTGLPRTSPERVDAM